VRVPAPDARVRPAERAPGPGQRASGPYVLPFRAQRPPRAGAGHATDCPEAPDTLVALHRMLWFWLGFLALVTALLALDLGLLNRRAHRPTMREALTWSAMWISLGVAFSGAVYLLYEHRLYGTPGHNTIEYSGADALLTYLTGFILEKSLSIDNLFVMVLIFRSYRVPGALQHRVLFWGILGALVMRAGMILGGVWLITHFTWVMYLFGAYLVVQGALQLKGGGDDEEEEGEPKPTLLTRMVGRVVPVLRSESNGRFFVRIGGRLHVTTLMVALLSVEGADAVFALDSVPAVLTVSSDPFIVFTSNVFAILGLRSLYFVIADMMDRFALLKYALAFILTFVGVKMLLHDVYVIELGLSLGLIAAAILAGIVASMISTRPRAP
jgi:tellurite resistance protein TerC